MSEQILTEKPNIFVRMGKGIAKWFKNLGKSIANFFVRMGKGIARWFRNFGERFADGSVGTKMSHFIMGAGNFQHKQIAKGIIFLLVEILFVLFMVLCPAINGTPLGYKALANLGNLGYMESAGEDGLAIDPNTGCLLYTDPSPLDRTRYPMPSSA